MWGRPVLALGGFIDLTGAGVALMLFGALVVTVFADLEFLVHRRAAASA